MVPAVLMSVRAADLDRYGPFWREIISMTRKKPWKLILMLSIIVLALAGAAVLVVTLVNPEVDVETERQEVLGPLDKNQGVSGLDLSAKDLSKASLEMLSGLVYDNATVWPDVSKLPASFSPSGWLDACRDPGLGVRDLHRQGITGQGVSVAVFDKPIDSTHMEYGGRLVYMPVKDISGSFETLHFHGQACASIIAGDTCGVAPGVKLYYFAVPDNGMNIENYCAAMDALIAFNQALPAGEKIRLLSISDGLQEQGTDWEHFSAALARAKAAGIDVNYSNSLGNRFFEGGCPPYKDKDDPDNYIYRYPEAKKAPFPVVIVPGDYRTTAENESSSACRYWNEGGFSWTIAYTAGLCALAYQVDPGITYEKILDLLYDTRTVNKSGSFVVDPAAFIQAVEADKSH